jgi:hypothetical protein
MGNMEGRYRERLVQRKKVLRMAREELAKRVRQGEEA